jgi:hypothetical protein
MVHLPALPSSPLQTLQVPDGQYGAKQKYSAPDGKGYRDTVDTIDAKKKRRKRDEHSLVHNHWYTITYR